MEEGNSQEELTPLRHLQLVELDLFCRFAEVCEKHHLRYFMLEGTLLGAVREKGFIPWDNDIDIGMPRPDYERLLEMVRHEPDLFKRADDRFPLSFTSLYDDEDYRQGMAKLSSPEVRIINRSANIEHMEDAWIDIVPIDGFPSGALASAVQKTRIMWWRIMDATAEFDHVIDTKRDRGVVGSVALKGFSVFCRVIRPYGDNFRHVLLKLDETLKRYAYDKEDKIINLYASWGFNEIFPKSYLGNGKPLEFEGRQFMAPDDFHAVLRTTYGPDYMTPPPEGQRDWHNAEILR